MRRIRLVLLMVIITVAISVTPTFAGPVAGSQVQWLPYTMVQGPLLPAWLERVNAYRAQAGLAGVDYDPVWSYGTWLHARYIVKEDELTHTEDPKSPWYTPEGALAGQKSNVMGYGSVTIRDTQAIDVWMRAPFHALGILDPRLTRVGFGSYRENVGVIRMAAVLDVIRGIDWRVPFPADVVVWPGNGVTVPLRTFSGEWPDPLTSCPGYTVPAGLPILVLAPGKSVQKARVYEGGHLLDVCAFDAHTYSNPDKAAQDLARSILDMRGATVIIPRSPLEPGKAYRVVVEMEKGTKSWSFRVWERAGG